MMTVNYHPSPEQFRHKGTVYLAWDKDRHTYWGYWDLEPDGKPTPLEPCPESPSEGNVLAWARARTHRVVIRPRTDPDISYYWTGEGGPPPDLSDWQKDTARP
jgi:hypothetical protein